jgi:hypothetical protein
MATTTFVCSSSSSSDRDAWIRQRDDFLLEEPSRNEDEQALVKMGQESGHTDCCETASISSNDDDDSCGSLDLMADGSDDLTQPSIHYLGRKYFASEFHHSQQVLSELSSTSRYRQRDRDGLSQSEHVGSTRPSYHTTSRSSDDQYPSPLSSSRHPTNGMNMSHSEHVRSIGGRSGPPPSTRRTGPQKSSSTAMPASSWSNRMNQSWSPVDRMGSTHTPRKSSAAVLGLSHSEHWGRTRTDGNNSSKLSSLHALSQSVRHMVFAQDPKTKQLQQVKASHSRKFDVWNYDTQLELMEIATNDRLLEKLKRDLRKKHAVTNSLLKQRIHVFVHNSKRKQQHRDEEKLLVEQKHHVLQELLLTTSSHRTQHQLEEGGAEGSKPSQEEVKNEEDQDGMIE